MQNPKPVLDGISVPVVMLDADLRATVANAIAFERFPELEIGKGLDRLWGQDHDIERMLRQTLERRVKASVSVVTDETFQREYLLSINPLPDEVMSGARGLLLTFEDQTPLRIAKSMRSDFVANVSHEIRSPLTAISGFVETLQENASDDPEAARLFLSLMDKEVARMKNLVADLLSLSKVEAKQDRAPKKPLDLEQTIHEAIEAVTSLAKKRGKQLNVDIAPDLPPVRGKRDDLVRALINLIENAINYSHEDSTITVIARHAHLPNPLKTEAVFVSIRDQGDGIAAAEIPRLTERFYRVDKSRSRNVGGTGLGLAIVKHILMRHRGVLTIESTVGRGSSFTAYLPVAATQQKT